MRKLVVIVLGVVLLMSSIVIAQSIIIKSNKNINDSNLYLSLGDFLLKQGYEEAALAAYNKAIEVDPTNKEVLNNLGYYYKDKNPLLAEDYFKKALESDSAYETARSNLALLYNKLGDYSKSVEELKILVKAYPYNIHYNYDLAINLANKYYHETRIHGDLIEAIAYFKIVYEMDPNFEHSLDNIKVLEEIRRMYEE